MWWLWSEICVALQFIWESQPRIESYYVVDGHHKCRLAVPYYSRTLTKNKQSVQPLFLSLISDHPSNSAVTLSGWLFCLSSAIAVNSVGTARNVWWWSILWRIRPQIKSNEYFVLKVSWRAVVMHLFQHELLFKLNSWHGCVITESFQN